MSTNGILAAIFLHLPTPAGETHMCSPMGLGPQVWAWAPKWLYSFWIQVSHQGHLIAACPGHVAGHRSLLQHLSVVQRSHVFKNKLLLQTDVPALQSCSDLALHEWASLPCTAAIPVCCQSIRILQHLFWLWKQGRWGTKVHSLFSASSAIYCTPWWPCKSSKHLHGHLAQLL